MAAPEGIDEGLEGRGRQQVSICTLLHNSTVGNRVNVVDPGQKMEAMSDKENRLSSVSERHDCVVEDGLAHMSVKGTEWVVEKLAE